MSNRDNWRSQLAGDLMALQAEYGRPPIDVNRMLDIELVLTLMHEYFRGEDPMAAWAVLNGQAYPALQQLPTEGRKAVAIARHRLSWISGRDTWERHLRLYKTVPEPYPLYKLGEKGHFEETSNPITDRRKDILLDVLRTPPPRPPRPPAYAPAGRYRFFEGRSPHEVEIGHNAAQVATRPVPLLALDGQAHRSPIVVSMAELRATAAWMDNTAKPGTAAHGQSWAARLRAIDMRRVGEEGLLPEERLTLDGLLHMIGMVGSGKSSLLTVLTVHLARRGYRVTIVQSDVASLLREQATFESLREADPNLHAVPMIGRSTRLTHLRRLHDSIALISGPTLEHDHPAYTMLSTVCPLDGLRRDTHPPRPGQEPCTSLYPLPSDADMDEEEDDQDDHSEVVGTTRFDCPLMTSCPVHAPTRDLADARIWLATPASLLTSGPQQPLVPEKLRNLELVVRSSDVVLVDEADLMQVQFDDRFAPHEVLVGGKGALLDRWGTQVSRQIYRPGRPLVGKRYALDRWLTAHQNLQRAVDRLYAWLREHEHVRGELSRDHPYFNGERLLTSISSKLYALDVDVTKFRDAIDNFTRTPLGKEGERDEELHPWTAAVQIELVRMDTPVALGRLQRWLREELALPANITDYDLDALSQSLLVALLVEVMGHSLHDVIVEWQVAAESLDLDRGSGGLFYDPPESLMRLTPEAPMGPVLGFQYYDSENSGEGELRFFRVRGMGRWLLYHLQDCLIASHNIVGPHVVLTSGTSWAPGSWKYHLHVEPEIVLVPSRAHACAETTCTFEPVPDPNNVGKYLSVSGIREQESRIFNLRTMVTELAKPKGFDNKSAFDRELLALDEDRRRIMLVVGNYDEARAVGELLRELRGGSDEVLTLVPDAKSDDDVDWQAQPGPGRLLRSMLKHMPTRWQEAKFLIAPLLAVERGHNILVADSQLAAIGSVYFLVRPMPVPGDPHTAVQRINYWASEYVPSLQDRDATSAGKHLREVAKKEWQKYLRGRNIYSEMENDARSPLLWTQLVLVWQCIGRLLRGGANARVHFVDAKWAENWCDQKPDTEATSMLLGFERILADALSDTDPARRAIAEALYGAFAQALGRMKTPMRAEQPQEQRV